METQTYKEVRSCAAASEAGTATEPSERSEMPELKVKAADDTVSGVEEAIELMGGFGPYQYRAVLTATLCFFLGSYCAYPMGFYELQPAYECRFYDAKANAWSAEWLTCTNVDFCPNLGATKPSG